jgi:hypothetical protein
MIRHLLAMIQLMSSKCSKNLHGECTAASRMCDCWCHDWNH